MQGASWKGTWTDIDSEGHYQQNINYEKEKGAILAHSPGDTLNQIKYQLSKAKIEKRSILAHFQRETQSRCKVLSSGSRQLLSVCDQLSIYR